VRSKPPARFGKGPSKKDPGHGHLVGGLLHSSGTYFPPPVRAVEIPKQHGGDTRMLGIPTVADRVAQTVVARHLGVRVEPAFHDVFLVIRVTRAE